jgi:eukaryotic-like serine/threonine-protein kinase
VPRQLAGYRLLAKLGQGGMGAVFRAYQVSMNRMVALKVLPPDRAADPKLRARFINEARLSGRVQHQNVIACYDLGQDQGHWFMSLELVEKGDAAALAKDLGGALPERMALNLMRDCARGIDAIHRANLLHRDIKPSNIFLTANFSAKLADLGVAKDLRRGNSFSKAGAILGTPAYMPPEQARGEAVDFRCDIYSLGASFYHLISGKMPFPAVGSKEMLAMLVEQPTPDLRSVMPNASAELAQLFARTMAKNRNERPRSALELLELIEPLCPHASDPQRRPDLRTPLLDEPDKWLDPY